MRSTLPGATLTAVSLLMLWASYGLGLGTVRQPAPGFFPFWISACLAAASLVMLGRSLVQREDLEGAAPFSLKGLRPALAVLLGIGLFAILLEYLGFFFTTLVLLAFFWLAVAGLSPWRGVFLAAAAALIATLLFDTLLGVHFPRGPFGF